MYSRLVKAQVTTGSAQCTWERNVQQRIDIGNPAWWPVLLYISNTW